MPINSPEDYAQAKEYASQGKASPKLLASMKAYETQRDNDPHMSEQTSQQSLDAASGAPVVRPPAPPGKKGLWIPNRPLGVTDYIPADVGGTLTNWRETSLDDFKDKVLLPQREKAIHDGMMAQYNLQKLGVGAFAPETLMQMTVAIAQGKAAEAQDPNKLTEESPEYKQFNDQQWQAALQQHIAKPDAGPMQRISRQGTLARASDALLGGAIAAGKGALDAMTLGADNLMKESRPSDYALGAWTNATGAASSPGESIERPAMFRDSAAQQEAHPIASFGGKALGMLLPGSAAGALFRNIYAPTKAALGAGIGAGLRAGALAGAGTAAAEGAVEDAGLDSGGLESFLEKTPSRVGLGLAAGAAGDALAQGAGALATKLDMNSVKRAGRPIFSWLEARGYKFNPILGEVSPPEAMEQLRLSAIDPKGTPVAQRISAKAGGPINDRVLAESQALRARQGAETEGYFAAAERGADPGPPVVASPLEVLPRPSSATLAAHREAMGRALPSVTAEEAEAVRKFTHGYDQSIRDMQRGASDEAVAASHPRGREHAAEARGAIPHLESYMAKMPPATEVPVVYRGLTLPENEAAQLLRQRTLSADPIAESAVTSVSADPVVARSFVARNLEPGQTGIVFKLHHRSAVGTGPLASDRMQVEKELLMPGRAKFEVIRRYEDSSNPGQFIIEAQETGAGHVARGQVPTTETRRALTEVISKHSGGPLDFTAPLRAELQRMPDSMTPQDFSAMMERIGASADSKAATGSAKMLADAWRRVEGGAMADMQKAPDVPGARDWATIREHHNFETTRMDRARQDTGVRENNSEWDFLSRDQQAPVRKAIEGMGAPGARVETEQALKRFAPPDIRQELETLEAMNAARAHVNGPWTGLASDSGTLKYLSGAAQPRIYGAARGLAREVGGDMPISEKLFAWLNARAPRATLFLQGLGQQQLARELARQQEINNRPKKFSDLTPEQVQVFNQALGN